MVKRVLTIVIASFWVTAESYNWELDRLNMNIVDQTRAINDVAWAMERAAAESAKLREAEERTAAITVAAERQRRREAKEQAAAAEAARQAEYEAARSAAAERLEEEQQRTKIAVLRFVEQLNHNAEMEKLKRIELAQMQKEREERDAYRCEWVEDGLRCPLMKVAGGQLCANHAEEARRAYEANLVRQAKELAAEKRRQEFMASLPLCKAERCGKRVLPHSEFCAKHQPSPPSEYDGLEKDAEGALRISKTKESIAALERNIDNYRRSTNGRLPESIKGMRVMLGCVVNRSTDEWGTEIYYETDGVTAYALQSAGPDKKFETSEDNITVIRRSLPPLK